MPESSHSFPGNLTKHMKSKAHSKKCQETGVLEELEAEEGNELPTPSSPSPYLPLPLLAPWPSPSFLSSLPLLPLLLSFLTLFSSFPKYKETKVKFTEQWHPRPSFLQHVPGARALVHCCLSRIGAPSTQWVLSECMVVTLILE